MRKNRVLDRLHALMPHLTRQDILNKIHPTDITDPPSAFLFFRAFVPYFSDAVERKQLLDALDIAKKRYRCWCVGDPHLENFGVLAQFRRHKREQILFTMNDPDDGGYGYPAMDLLRYLTGCRLAGRDVVGKGKTIHHRLKAIIHAYRQGLKDDHWPKSLHAVLAFLDQRGIKGKTQDKVRDGMQPGCTADPKGFNAATGTLIRENSSESHYSISTQEQSLIRAKIAQEFSDHYTLSDLIQFSKQSGGSGGLIQYRVLLKRRKSARKKWPKWVILDVKPLVRAGIYPVFRDHLTPRVSTSLDPKIIRKRANTSLRRERVGNHCYFNRATVLDSMGPFLLRVRWRGQFNVNTQKHVEKDHALMRAEAWVMGMVHRKTLRHRATYRQQLNQTHTQSTLLKQSKQLAKQMRQAFRCVQ
ncbi:MAG: DUF2252 family protein [Magnetococcales bacterium]|nr:DUF2252 family protein [Magnetococcales bacterium]